jgi:hypothetical protein
VTTSCCKSCGAEIVWVVTPAGKSMPLDAKAQTVWVLEPEGATAGSPKAKPVQARGSHFATCPNADEHRSSR